MDTPAEDSDSDVEVLDPKLLKYRYRRQELRLITALSKCADNQIPKQWEDFQIFVKNVLKFHLSPRLVRSVWVQLHACYQLANSASSCSVVEIVDEEEGTEVVKQNDDNFINIGGAIQEKLRDKEWEKLINERSSDYVEISDEEEIKQVVKHENDNFSSNITEVIHERLKPGDEVEKSSNGQSSCDVEIIDEKDSTQIVKKHYEQINDVGGGIHKRLKSGNREDKLCRQQSGYLKIIEEDKLIARQRYGHFLNAGGIVHEEFKSDLKREKSSGENSYDYVEIIDEKDSTQIVKQHYEQINDVGGGIRERLKPGDEVEKSSNGQSSCDVEIIDEKDSTQIVKQHYEQINDVGGGIRERLKPGNTEDKLCRQQSSGHLEIIEEDKLIARQRYGHFLNAGGIVHEEFKSDLKREKSSDENSYHYVEISDEEEIEQAVDQHKQLVSIVEVAHEELKPHIKEEKSNNELSCDCIEISDDESKEATKQHDQVMDTRRVFHEESAPGINREKFKQDLSHDVEITDGKQNTNQSHIESNISTKCDNILMPTLERSFIMPNGSKQNRKRTRCSLPASIKEAEAEALREKLLLDKIIELELPQVIKSFMNRNNIVKNCTKKRRRKSSVNNKKSVNGTPSDVSVSVPEII